MGVGEGGGGERTLDQTRFNASHFTNWESRTKIPFVTGVSESRDYASYNQSPGLVDRSTILSLFL